MSYRVCVVVGAVVAGSLLGARALAQHAHPPAATTPAKPEVGGVSAPRRISEVELHAHGGVPRGWRFAVEPGNAASGRQVFSDLECFKCHRVAGEGFPPPTDGKHGGPDLTGMGGMHPAEYIAESILFPNHVIVDERGYTGSDGRSTMPSYADSLTVTQWLDLVAYLRSLTGGRVHPAGHRVERVVTAGDYRIRLVYAPDHHHGHAGHGPAGGSAHGGHGTGAGTSSHGGHGTGAGPSGHGGHGTTPATKAAAQPGGHLMAFITERETGEAVPYLPVTVVVQGPGATRQSLTLRPMIGQEGFHYGADARLSERTDRVTVTVGAITARVAASAKGRFTKPVTAVIEWSAPRR